MADEANKNDQVSDKDKSDETPPPPHHEEISTESTHSVKINGKLVPYTASAGRLILTEEEGKKKASFFFVAYNRNGVKDVSKRPIVFAFNGGPGSSSVWLHLGALGPRRVHLDDDGMPFPPPGQLVDNEHSILDVADLVFIDPIGTGFSRAIPRDEGKDFHHFKKDIEAVGEFIRVYLTRHQRWGSPKFLAGESYGTTRSAGLAGHLYTRHGITFNGLMLISSILNFQTAGFDDATGTFLEATICPISSSCQRMQPPLGITEDWRPRTRNARCVSFSTKSRASQQTNIRSRCSRVTRCRPTASARLPRRSLAIQVYLSAM